jgi:uncharacterized membrane protein (DUF485 family)
MSLFTNLYYRYLKFPSEFKNQHGITALGNVYHNSLVIRAVNNGRSIRRSLVKANVIQKINEEEIVKLEKSPMVENDQFHSLHRNMRWQNFLFAALLISEIGLNIFTARIIIPAFELRGLVWDIIRLMIAIAVTVTATWACDKFLEVVFGKKHESVGGQKITKLVIYLMIFIFAEVVIAYFGLVRAKDLEGNDTNVTTAMTILAMIVPVVAGAIWWNIHDRYDEYKNRVNYDTRLSRRASLISAIKDLKESELIRFKELSNRYWYTFMSLRTYKENFNARKNITEQVTDGHLISFEHFNQAAYARYIQTMQA